MALILCTPFLLAYPDYEELVVRVSVHRARAEFPGDSKPPVWLSCLVVPGTCSAGPPLAGVSSVHTGCPRTAIPAGKQACFPEEHACRAPWKSLQAWRPTLPRRVGKVGRPLRRTSAFWDPWNHTGWQICAVVSKLLSHGFGAPPCDVGQLPAQMKKRRRSVTPGMRAGGGGIWRP